MPSRRSPVTRSARQAAGLIDYLHGYSMGWRVFVYGDLPQPIVVALCLGLLRRANLRPSLKVEGLLTRDPRKRERKKYGQPGARKRFQYSKR